LKGGGLEDGEKMKIIYIPCLLRGARRTPFRKEDQSLICEAKKDGRECEKHKGEKREEPFRKGSKSNSNSKASDSNRTRRERQETISQNNMV